MNATWEFSIQVPDTIQLGPQAEYRIKINVTSLDKHTVAIQIPDTAPDWQTCESTPHLPAYHVPAYIMEDGKINSLLPSDGNDCSSYRKNCYGAISLQGEPSQNKPKLEQLKSQLQTSMEILCIV